MSAKTAPPVPVSPVTAANSCAELKEPNTAALPTEVTCPVKLALVVTLPAVNPAAVPVRFVATPEAGVPSAGATNVLLFNVCARVVKTKVSATLAKSGMVKVVPPTVWPVKAMLTNWSCVRRNGMSAEVAREVDEATPRTGVTNVGVSAKTKAPVPVPSVIAVIISAEVSTSIVKPPFIPTNPP